MPCYIDGMKTIAQIAEELGVTPQTIRNEIERQSLRSFCQKSGRSFCIDEEGERRIKSAIVDRKQNKSKTKFGVDFAKPLQKEEGTLLLVLREELAAKNAQIEELQRQRSEQEERHAREIAALTAALENVSASLKAAQALHAGTLQERLEAKQAVTEEGVTEGGLTKERGPEEGAPQEEEAAAPEDTVDVEKKRRWWQFWK